MVEFTPYKLRQTIAVHSNDVRAVRFVGEDRVLTTSRDGSAKLTTSDGLTTDVLAGPAFLNAATVDAGNAHAYIGSLDGTITAVALDSGAQRLFAGHTANVTALDCLGSRLVSASWDTTVRVWDTPDASVVLQGHTQYVWDAKFVDADTVVSASADRTIRVWDVATRAAVRTLAGHDDVVRALLVLSPSALLSASNDGTIRRWDLGSGALKATWRGHTSFVYSLAALGGGRVASSGEDRTVRIWDAGSGQPLQTIMMPSISQWAVASSPLGELVVGSSDNTARVFTAIAARQADAAEQARFAEAVQGSAIGEAEVSDADVSPADVLQRPGKQEGQVVVVRNPASAKLEAHQFSGGVWAKIGDVVGASQASGSKKHSFAGQQYDYVFDVDIADGADPLKLPFNNSDNPYEVAERFVAEHSLPPSYVDQVVKFLITNSEAKQFGAAGAGSSAPAGGSAPEAGGNPTGSTGPTGSAGSTGPASSENIPSALRFSTPLFIKSFQPEPLLRALHKIAADKGENLGVYHLDALLASLPSSANELLTIAVELHGKWAGDIQHLLPVYDLLRIAVADADAVTVPYQVVWTELLSALDAQVPKHCMLAVRGVANLVGNSGFDGRAPIHGAMLAQAVAMLQGVAAATPGAFARPQAVALATLILNLAVRALPSVGFPALIAATAPKIVASGDPEAAYRLLLAVGLRSVAGEGTAYHASWFAGAPAEPRITELLEVVKPRIAA